MDITTLCVLYIIKSFYDVLFRKDIGIFFCGPAMLSEALDKASTEANTKLENENLGSMFFYNKENF